MQDVDEALYAPSDIVFSGTTLFGQDSDNGELYQIDTTTGVVTLVGADEGYGGLAIDSTGAMYHVATGGSSNLETIDPTTATPTTVAALNYPTNAIVCALKFWGTTLLAVMNDNGAVPVGGGITALAAQPTAGTTLAAIDLTTAAVTPLFELPTQPGGVSHIDAMDIAPATLVIATPARIAGAHWQKPVRPTAAAVQHGCAASMQLAAGHDKRTALTAFGGGALTVTTCSGDKLAISAADRAGYAVVKNHRGMAKLVDSRTGKTILRDVASITRR
jgi:hypothetical protein